MLDLEKRLGSLFILQYKTIQIQNNHVYMWHLIQYFGPQITYAGLYICLT